MDISGKLAQANGRLKAANVGVTIEQQGDRLRLRSTFPPRPGSSRKQPYQQRLCLGVRANPAGLKEAEAEARKIGALLSCREFDWTPYLRKSSPSPQSAQEWIERYREHYLSNDGTQATWEGDYWKVYRRLPLNQPLDVGVMEACILGTKANTKSRVRACMAIGTLAKFAGIEYDPAPLRGHYNHSKTSRRDLPDDDLIVKYYHQIDNPAWRWVYGVMACYGLRNHEVFYLNLDEFPIIEVGDKTKTGWREVFPFYPEWAEEWHLDRRILPPVTLNRSNDKIGHSVTKYLSPKLPFFPYDLRHAWAVRTLSFNLPIEVAARQMGHSVDVHQRTYHKWISKKHYRKLFELLVMREDRPKPPQI